jgi:hypothetical protein
MLQSSISSDRQVTHSNQYEPEGLGNSADAQKTAQARTSIGNMTRLSYPAPQRKRENRNEGKERHNDIYAGQSNHLYH